MGSKRKRMLVTMKQRLLTLERIGKGYLVQSIYRYFNDRKSTISGWRWNRESTDSFGKFGKFVQQPRRGTPINGPILKEKTIILHFKLPGAEDAAFAASEGWLSCMEFNFLLYVEESYRQILQLTSFPKNDYSSFLKIIFSSWKYGK